MKTPYKHSVIVGFFITIGLLLLVTAVFFLGGQQKKFIRTITIKAIFDDINGLQAGNNIWLFGVKIGTVSKVNFYGPSKVEVVMIIEKDAQEHIHRDATAKISSDGFIGNRIVVLKGGTQNTSIINDGDNLKTAEITNTDQILYTLQENNKNLLDITNNIKTVSQKLLIGEGTLAQLLNEPVMANDLKASIANIKKISVKTEMVVNDFKQFSEGLHKQGSLAQELVNDTVVFKTVIISIVNLKKTSDNLALMTSRMDSIAGNIHHASESINDIHKPIGMVLNDKEVAIQLKSMMNHLESSSKKLEEDLEAVQHNFLLKGFFRKKEKAKQVPESKPFE